jgi:hypothetical protein
VQVNGGITDHSEKPGLKIGIAMKDRLSIHDFQVDCLKDILCILFVPVATGQSPAKACLVMFLKEVLRVLFSHVY